MKRPRPNIVPSQVTNDTTAVPPKDVITIKSYHKMALPNYLSNLQELIELEDYGEKVIWPDGLDSTQAKSLIKNYTTEWEQAQAEEGSQSDFDDIMNREEQVGDPSLLPRVHGKEVQYIKPLPKPEMRKPASRRKCVFGDDYNRI